MLRRTISVFLALCAVGVLPLLAQDIQADNPKTLTGCLTRGEAVTAYKLTATDGAEWHLTFDKKMKMSPYITHTVTVTGNIVETAETKSGDPKDAKKSAGNTFNVTKIVSMSDMCSK